MKHRQMLVKSYFSQISKRRRSQLLGVNLSSCYVKSRKSESFNDVNLLNEIRDIYEVRPFQGYRRITLDLKDLGHVINHKKVYRLMKFMGLKAVYPRQNLSKRNYEHRVHPYLLKDNPPQKPHDAWCVDITYIKIAKGFVYLTALIDVVSRYVMGWHLSTDLDTENCLKALENAISKGYMPDIINSDQGCQFTSQEWAYQLSFLKCKLSMDGKGRALDNIPIERFWRTIKYEEVYLKTYESVKEARESLDLYIAWYNNKRRHSGINNHRPYEVMTGKAITTNLIFNYEKTEKNPACGHVDNSLSYHTSPQCPTTTKEKINIKKENINHSSENAA